MEELDCKKCGACCVEAGSVSVFYPEDAVPRWRTRSIRDVRGYDPLDVERGVRMMDRYLGGRCKALDGVVCQSVSCRVYDVRPSVCREFEPGSAGCIESRKVAFRKNRDHGASGKYRGYGEDWRDTVL